MPLTPGDRGHAARLADALNVLRRQHKDMTITQALFLLNVAAKPGSTQVEIAAGMGMSQATATRAAHILSSAGDRKVAVFGLIEPLLDHGDGRVRLLHLTARGENLIHAILRSIGHDRPTQE